MDLTTCTFIEFSLSGSSFSQSCVLATKEFLPVEFDAHHVQSNTPFPMPSYRMTSFLKFNGVLGCRLSILKELPPPGSFRTPPSTFLLSSYKHTSSRQICLHKDLIAIAWCSTKNSDVITVMAYWTCIGNRLRHLLLPLNKNLPSYPSE